MVDVTGTREGPPCLPEVEWGRWPSAAGDTAEWNE